jgi:hypothetical protein
MFVPDETRPDGIDSLTDQIGCSARVLFAAVRRRGRIEVTAEKKRRIRTELQHLMKRNTDGVKRSY